MPFPDEGSTLPLRAGARLSVPTVAAGGARGTDPADALPAGTVLAARYRIVAHLGAGGMGAVYEAEDAELGARVALKTIHPGRARGDDALRRLKQEVLLARLVTHGNVCRLYDLGRDADRDLLFCTMELLRGETLLERLRARGPIAPADALPLVRQMAAGLDAAHAAGVVHRDFKCGNVMLAGGRAVVTDFGLALPVAAQEGAAGPAPPEEVAGTLAYMAPEQLRGEHAGPPADVYALGVVLYEMVTGRLPFEGDGSIAAAMGKLERDPPSPRRDAPDLPSAWEAAILRCLAREPAARFESAGSAAAALADGVGAGTLAGRGVTGNLPPERDSFVGRDVELAALGERLRKESRLLTILGPAGCGKTRFAIRLGATLGGDRPGGVWFCDLSTATGVEGIVSAVAAALDVPLGKDDPVVQLGHAIAGRGRCLVILDNFEQAVGHAAATLGKWHDRATEASFLVTSRARLRLAGEATAELGPLPEDAGVALFRARAESHRTGSAAEGAHDEDIRRIVRRADGLPLAIELAAARVRLMSPAQIAERFSQRWKLLAGSHPSGRHANLRAAIDASWELLEPWEQSAFAQCSVFEGGFTLEAAEAVLDLSAWPEAPWTVDVVQSLVDRSLLRLEGEGAGAGAEPRFGMLVSLQEYAREMLAPEESHAADTRHGAWFAGFGTVEAIEALDGAGGAEKQRRLGSDFDNLVAACRRAVTREDSETAVAGFCAAWAVLALRGPFAQGIELGRDVLRLPGLPPPLRARALCFTGLALLSAGRLDDARAHYEAALAFHRQAGNRPLEGYVLGCLGNLHLRLGRTEEARELYEAALASHRETGDRRLEAYAVGYLGNLDKQLGRTEEAREHHQRALALHREIGNRRSEGITLGNLGILHLDQGRIEEARELCERALTIHREVGNRPFEGVLLGNLGSLEHGEGRRSVARAHYEAAIVLHREVGNRRSEGIVLGNLGELCREEGRREEARERFELALRIARESGDRATEGFLLGTIGSLDADARRPGDARDSFDAGERLLREAGDRFELGKLLCSRGRMETTSGDLAAARACFDEAAGLARELRAGPDSELARGVEALRAALESAGGNA